MYFLDSDFDLQSNQTEFEPVTSTSEFVQNHEQDSEQNSLSSLNQGSIGETQCFVYHNQFNQKYFYFYFYF